MPTRKQEKGGRLGTLVGDGTFWFAVTLMLWLPYFLSLLQMPHFVFWDFWCAPGDLGLQVSGLFFLIAFLGIAWTMTRALASTGSPTLGRLFLEVVMLGYLMLLIHVLTVWFNSPYCRIAASPENARTLAGKLGEEWVPPQGYRAVTCHPSTQAQCWRRRDLPPYAEAEPFGMLPPARSVADRHAVCEAGLRLAYRPQRVEILSGEAPPPKSHLLSHCEREGRIPLPSDVVFLYAKIFRPPPESASVSLVHFPEFYICRFSDEGRLQSAVRFNSCDLLRP